VNKVVWWCWRPVRAVLLALAAVVFAIEEWGWQPLSAMLGRLARWPAVARLEQRIREAPPAVALGLFLVPALLLFPIKLAALWLISLGRTVFGVSVIVLAKLLGTALLGRLFVLTEPQLVRYRWFALTLAWWRTTKQRVQAALGGWPAWQAVRSAWQRMFGWLRRRGRGDVR
jgi:hypothetical protein